MSGHSAYARGGWALGQCARSGRKMLLRNMVADGYYPNLIVDSFWYEPKHPQESLPSVRDPVSLFRPAPERTGGMNALLILGGAEDPDDVPGGGFGQPSGGSFANSQVAYGYEIGGVGFSSVAHIFPTAGDPDDWTLIEAWDTRNGVGDNELASIDAAFGGLPRGSAGAVWNVAKTVLTLGSSSNDTIRTFVLSTANDPDTASLIATRSVTNPSHMYMNRAGSILWNIHIVGDEISALPCNNFVIGAGAELSDMTKSQAGYTGSGDGGYYPMDNLEWFIWDGTIPAHRTKRIDVVPDGDLEGFILDTEVAAPYTVNASIGGSKISADETTYYRGIGAGGVERVVLTVPGDPTGGFTVTTHAIEPEVTFRPTFVIVDPEDTTEVWIVGDNSGLQMARMATNQ